MTDNYNDNNLKEINGASSNEAKLDENAIVTEELKPDLGGETCVESVPQETAPSSYGANTNPQGERAFPTYAYGHSATQPPVSPVENIPTYGGFSQKKKYEKACRKGNGFKILALVMSVLFVMTASGFVTYYVMSKKYEKQDESTDKNNEIIIGETVDNPDDKAENVFASVEDEVKMAQARENEELVPEYTGEKLTNQEIIALANPSVVGIKTQVQAYSYFGPALYEGVGSGFVLTESGYIVTNCHVIEDATAIKVILENGNEYDAQLVGSDDPSDVAVLKIEPAEPIYPVVIGDSDKVVAGDSVIAIGCPSGIELSGTATSGIVSKAKRELTITDDYGRFEKTLYVIQIDAAINPGNSGGPLLNDRGEVIGINTLRRSSGYVGIGFALPINGVMDIVNQLCEEGTVTTRGESSYVKGKAALGITYNELTEQESTYYQVPRGVIVVLATPGGAAQRYGIKGGDIIVGYNGKKITSADDLLSALNSSAPGDEATITIWRDGSEKDIVVILGESS